MPKKQQRSSESTADWFMIRVAEGMAAWATFAQATFLSPVYSEALTYRPIFEIARPRDWKPWPQKKIAKRERKLGRNQTVDFAFQSKDKKVGVFLEVKFLRKRTKHCAKVSKDVRKLALLNENDISDKESPKAVFRYILLIGTREDIKSRIRAYAKKMKDGDLAKLQHTEDRRLLKQVQSAFKNKIRKAKGFDAWAFPGLGNDKWKYWSVLLKQQQWWKQLAQLSGELTEDDETPALEEAPPAIEESADDAEDA